MVHYPPLVDLPQHAAQVATDLQWADGSFPYPEHLSVNRRTPYLVSPSLASALAHYMPVNVAFQLLLSLAVLGIPLATLGLVREVGGRPIWALMAIPAGYSFPFYMGFVAFALAAVLALVFLRVAWRYSGNPTGKRAWTLLLFSQLIFFTHPLGFGWAGLLAALLVAVRSPDWRQVAIRWWPLLAALLVPALWLSSTTSRDQHLAESLARADYSWTRLLQIAPNSIGLPINELSLALGLMVLVTPWLAAGRPARHLARWIPLAATLGLFFAFPSKFLSTGYLYPRFAMWILPCLLFALAPKPHVSRRPWMRRCVVLAPSALWLAFVYVQFLGVRAEIGAFGDLLETMEPDRKVLYLPVESRGAYLPFPTYLHYGSWYQAERGGMVDFSFASYFPSRFRYQPEHRPPLPHGFEFRPWTFDWNAHDGSRWDYFLVRSSRDPQQLFLRAKAPVVPIATATGGWWLYARRDSDVARTTAPTAPAPAP